MKFLCPNCKAKYQVADEKVAGRSVRMKCRKCSHLIHINSATAAPPSTAPPPPSGPGAKKNPHLAATVKRPEPQPSRASSPGVRQPAAPPRPRPSRPDAPRPGGKRPLSAPKASPSPVAAAPKPKTSSPAYSPSPSASEAARASSMVAQHESAPVVREHPMFDEEDDEMTRVVDSGAGLAAAFNRTLNDAPPPSDDLSAVDEWYVGVNGVPVGPLPLAQLRQKASSGVLTTESLVWKDGFEDWRPLSTFPELIAIVEEFRPPWAAAGNGSSATPAPAEAGLAADSIGIPPAATPGPVGGVVTPSPEIGFMQTGGAVAPETGPAVVRETESEFPVIPKRRSGWLAWAAVGVALVLGLTIGFVLFSTQKKTETVVKYVEVPGKGAASTSAAGQTAPTPSGDVEPDAGKKVAAGGPAKAGKVGSPSTKPPEKKGGLTGLDGLGSGVAGPNGKGTGGGSSGSTAGKPLDSSSVQRTVSRYTPSVRRSCWQPALNTRSRDAPSTARVSVSIRVAPSGSVQSVSPSGDPRGYRGLSSCIASRVRGWRFPASSGVTTVNVPFVFAAQ